MLPADIAHSRDLLGNSRARFIIQTNTARFGLIRRQQFVEALPKSVHSHHSQSRNRRRLLQVSGVVGNIIGARSRRAA